MIGNRLVMRTNMSWFNRVKRSLYELANKNCVAKIIVILLVWVVALVPAYIATAIYLLVNSIMPASAPIYTFILAVILAVVFGPPQFGLAFLGVIASLYIIFE